MKKGTWIILSILGGIILLTFSTQKGRSIVSEAIKALSNLGLSLIQRFEGLRLSVYQDEEGNWTIGWGHLVKATDPYYPYGDVTTITREEADQLLAQDTQEAQDAVNRLVSVPINQNQFDALTSFVFNTGEGAFAYSTLLSDLNNGDYNSAANEFNKWIYVTDQSGNKFVSNILVSRREQEKQIFLS